MRRRRKTGPDPWPARDRILYEAMGRSSRRHARRRYQSLSQAYIRGVEQEYGSSLRWLRAQDLLDPDASPAARWNADVIERMAVDMIEAGYAIGSVITRLERLKRMLKALEPEADLGYFDKLRCEFDPPKARFDPVVWKVTSADLQALGCELMDEAADMALVAPVEAAAQFCLGLQIALIAARPWRKRTFVLMELWENLTRDAETWRMIAQPSQTKQKRRQAARVPLRLAPYVEGYIATHRPVLCLKGGYTGHALWLSHLGTPMTPAYFLRHFKKLTEKKFGFPVTVHAVRKVAATTMAMHNPSNVHYVQGILGHAGPRQGEAHYILADAIKSHADLDSTIDRISKAARDRRRLSRRPSRGC